MNNQSTGRFERHLQTGIAAVIVGLVMWVGISINDVSRSQAGMIVEIRVLQEDVDEIRKQILAGGLPTADIRLKEISNRLDRLEARFFGKKE